MLQGHWGSNEGFGWEECIRQLYLSFGITQMKETVAERTSGEKAIRAEFKVHKKAHLVRV